MSLDGKLTVTDAKGARGTIDRRVTPLESAAGATVTVRMEDGREVRLPARSLAERSDGEFHVLSNFDELAAAGQNGDGLETRAAAGGESASSPAAGAVVPVVEEVLVVEKRLVLVEELHVRKRRVEERRPQAFTLRKEEVVAERLDAREARAAAQAGGFEQGDAPGPQAPALNSQSS